MGKQCARIPHGVLHTGCCKVTRTLCPSSNDDDLAVELKSELFMKKSSTGTVRFHSNA